MKLIKFEHQSDLRFALCFENGEVKVTDLKPLTGGHVPADQLPTARIDPDWGCLEFNQGLVDIEPQTLYRFAN